MVESPLLSASLWIAAAGGLLLGVGIGVLVARSGSRRAAARARELEDQLRTIETDHARYRNQVAEHFGETSRRLRDLTLQYKAVYEHLADGARTLCPDGSIEIAASLAEAALPAAAGAEAREHDDAQLDLELDPPDRWAASAHEADALDPILEEEVAAPAAAADAPAAGSPPNGGGSRGEGEPNGAARLGDEPRLAQRLLGEAPHRRM